VSLFLFLLTMSPVQSVQLRRCNLNYLEKTGNLMMWIGKWPPWDKHTDIHGWKQDGSWIPISEMTYTVLSGTLNSTIPYHSWIPVNLLPTRLRHFWSSPPAIGLPVVISNSHVWNLFRTEGVHLHTPALQTGTHFLLTLETI